MILAGSSLGYGALAYGAAAILQAAAIAPPADAVRLTGSNIGYGGAAYGAAQILEAAPTARASVAVNSGGWRFPYRIRSAEEIHRERVRLGIFPPPVQRAVEKAARRVINKARAQQPSGRSDPLQWLARNQAQERDALAHEFRKRELEFDRAYMAAVALEVERGLRDGLEREQQAEIDREESQILVLLMEM